MSAMLTLPVHRAPFIHPRFAAAAATREACAKAMDACRILSERGCQVLSAHAVTGRATVNVAPPPAAAGLSGSMIRRDRVREDLAAILPSGVVVRWSVRRSRRAGGAA